MIQIIKHGRLRQCTCYNCGCIFTHEKEDIKIEQTGINEYEQFVECPDCKERNRVNFTNKVKIVNNKEEN